MPLSFLNDYTFFLSTIFLLGGSSLLSLSPNPIYNILGLIFSFMGGAFILLLHNIEFLGLMVLIIYAGAIAILFLFVIMMLNIKEPLFHFPLTSFSYTANGYRSLIIFSCMWEFCSLGLDELFNYTTLNASYNYSTKFQIFHANIMSQLTFFNVEEIYGLGKYIYSISAIFFILMGVILLIGLMGALTLSYTYSIKINNITKNQYMFRQLSRSPENSIILLRPIKYTKKNASNK